MNVTIRTLRNKTMTAALLAGAPGLLTGRAVQAQVRPIILARAEDVAKAEPSSPSAKPTSGKAPNPAPAVAALVPPAAFPARPSSARTSAAAVVSAATPAIMTGTSGMEGDFYTPMPDEKILHLMVGHSVFIDTKHRLQRVYVTNPEVLNSYTASPNQVVLTAKSAGSSSFIMWDEVGDTQVYMVAADTNIDGLSGAIKKAFPTDEVEVSNADGRLTLSGMVGTQVRADAIAKFASNYSKDVANQIGVNSSKIKQVRLKVRFAEVDRSRVSQFGFNLFAILNGQGANPTLLTSSTGAFPSTITTGTSTTGSANIVGGQTVAVSNPLNFVLYNASHNIGATIQDLENKQIMHILAEPNITAMSGEKANFLAGGEFPFPVVQGGGAGTAATVTIIFKPFGVKLDFTPLVNPDGTIDLTVAPEVSALDYTNAVTVSGFTIPALSTRRANTHVALRDGQSFAISGLLDQRTTDALGRTPGIASIPILGALFRSKNINHSNSELIVIVTPEIVDPLTDHPDENKLPSSPIPMLNSPGFDQSLPASAKKPGGQK